MKNDQKQIKSPELSTEPVSFEEKTSWELEWRKERTKNIVVIVSISAVVVLIMTAMIIGALVSNSPNDLVNYSFLAISGFTNSIVVIIVMSFFDIKKGTITSSETNIEND